MMPEIELYCCGVKVKVFKHIIDEFNVFRCLGIKEYGDLVYIKDGDKVPPEILTDINNFCIASQQTQLIINRMKEAA